MKYVLHALVVRHVTHKKLYLGGVWLGGLPATPCGWEGGAVSGDLVDGPDALGLGEAWRHGGGGAWGEGGAGSRVGSCVELCRRNL